MVESTQSKYLWGYVTTWQRNRRVVYWYVAIDMQPEQQQSETKSEPQDKRNLPGELNRLLQSSVVSIKVQHKKQTVAQPV